MLRSSTQPVAVRWQFASRASTCFSHATRKLEVLVMPTLLRSLSLSCSEAADAQPRRCPWAHVRLHVYKCSLARAMFFFLPRQLLPRCNIFKKSPRSQGWHNHILGPLYSTPYKLNSMFESRYSTVNDTVFLSTFLRRHSIPRFNSNTPRAFCTASLKRWEII